MSPKVYKPGRPWIAAVMFAIVASLAVFTSAQQRPEDSGLLDPRDSLPVPILTFGPQGPAELQGLPDDWTHHHLVFSDPGTEQDAIQNGTYDKWLKIVNEPRYIMQQLKRGSPAQGPSAEDVGRIEEMARAGKTAGGQEASESPNPAQAKEAASALTGFALSTAWPGGKARPEKIKKDWDEALGATTAPSYASFPAKWSFNTTTASCANDFVIYPTGQTGSGTQASIIAYYNLYSGCTGTVPEVDWAYNTGGTVALAPVFSAKGSQIAIVQTSGTAATLALLTFPLTPPGTGTLAAPATPTSVTAANYPTCTAPCMTTISFSGTPNDTVSNPYYDYSTDSLYVGASNGTLHKFKPVFGGTPAEVVGSGWPLTLNANYAPTNPVYDGASACVFVGDTGGYLYSVNSGNAGTVCTSTTASVHGTSGQLDQTFGIRDAPLLDSTAARIYVFAGNDTSGNNGVFQFPTSFTSGTGTEAVLASGSDATGTTTYQLAGAFDNTYFSSSSSSSPSGDIYVCGTGSPATLYKIPISSNVMGTVVAGPTVGADVGTQGYYGRCSPVTEFFNTSAPIAATGTVTLITNPAGWGTGRTVTVGATTYTFVTGTPTAANQVELYTSARGPGGAATNEDDTAQNLYAVINASSAECYSAGCVYTGQTANASATATHATNVVTLTARIAGAGGDFTLSTNYATGITVSGGSNGSNGTDYIFFSVFVGAQTGCSNANANEGCVMSFNVTTPSNFSTTLTALGTLNVSSVTSYVPTGGLIIDNALSTPTGTSQIYFQTLYTAGTTPCTGICAVQASQAAP
jgi:hypothetical protein